MDEVKDFFKANDELLQSPTTDEIIHPKIVGNYTLDRNSVRNQVVDWIFHYLENRKCPYQLAVAIAKNTAQQIDSDIAKQMQENENFELEKSLNSVTLYTEAIKKVPSVCSYFLNEEKGEEMLSSCSEQHIASVFAIKNKRRKMEDRHVVHQDLNLLLDLKGMPAQSYYAVFDGHAGVDAASYASAHLHVNIAKHPCFLTDTPTAIAEAYKITDEHFLELCKKENIKSGSTAVCALIREKTVYLSWLGDSQAVLIKEGKPAIVTNPHKPEREDEQKRIEDLGGHISYMGVYRVNGVLAVTRALGDLDHKPYVSNEADVTTVQLDGKEDFLILACDGLWDGMSPEDVASALYRNLSESALDEPLDAVAAKLVHQSKLQGSEDNITAVVVFLRDIKEIKEYATKHVLQSSSQLNFLGMNGEGTVPYSKPTVLEFNAASTKKLKNAANVLSSAGFTDPSYCPYPGNIIGSSYQNISTDNSVFVDNPNIASCLPPEATALSELPTPPIDEIIASQQFENLCPEDPCQVLNSAHDSEIANPNNPDSNAPKSTFELLQEAAFVIENGSPNISVESNVISPDEAIGIASDVVSNTIETAVKCLSSELCEPIPVISTQKLNPNAKPFVMKSFIPDEQTPKEDSSASESSINEGISALVDLNKPENVSTESNKCIESSLDNQSSVMVDDAVDGSETNKEPLILSSPLPDSKNLCSPSGTLSTETSEESLACKISLLDLKDPGSSYHAEMDDMPQLVDQDILSSLLKDTVPKESEKSDVLQDAGLEFLQDHVDSGLIPETNPIEKMQNIETIVCEDLIVDANSKLQNLNLDESLKEESLKNRTSTPFKTKQQDLSENINLIDVNSNNSFDVKQEDSSQISKLGESHVETTRSALESLDMHLPCDFSSILPLNPEKSSLVDASLENVIEDPLVLLNIKDEALASAAILPSDPVDDCPVETFAVDLQTVPDGVPEAEGVTEDVDSDSEKDGGWSYMKVGSTKSKPNESTPKGLKPTSKPDSISKLKKDVQKPVVDNKTKLKSSILDKSKKPVAEKKTLDVKDRKPLKAASTLPKTTVEKPAKPASTVSRVKKEPLVSKVTAAPLSKLNRPAAPRNATSFNKPVQNTTTERSSTVATKAVGIPPASGNVRPKSALSTLPTKTNARPGGTSTLSKGLPSNQSNKSNVAPAARSATLNRPATSTVPSKVTAKPLATSKSAASETKPKPFPNTIKRTLPSALKKPDVKEAKDIANKQISAKSTLGAPSKNEVKSAISSNKHPATLNKKPLPTKTSTLAKNDVKKDVPKPAISRLNAKTIAPTKVSRDVTKGKVKKTAAIQETKIEKISSEVSNEQKIEEITSVCGEEKFILEVNDKEVAVKEQAETGVITDQMLIPVENGVPGNKPLEEISVGNPGSENLNHLT